MFITQKNIDEMNDFLKNENNSFISNLKKELFSQKDLEDIILHLLVRNDECVIYCTKSESAYLFSQLESFFKFEDSLYIQNILNCINEIIIDYCQYD